MSLEVLANELLLDVFECLHAYHIFHAFYGLNARLNQLLCIQLRKYDLDFCTLSKHDFELFCHQHLTSINDRIISLHLSDDVETPNLPRVFLSNGYRIDQFVYLRLLSIYRINCFDLLNQILFQCHGLLYLTHLKVGIQNYQEPEEKYRDCINSIWSLAKLTHCYLDIQYLYSTWLVEMSAISNSMKYLSIRNVPYSDKSLVHLMKHTPNLRRLEIGSISQYTDQSVRSVVQSLISLSTNVEYMVHSVYNLFQQMSNLRYLKLEVNKMHLDGYVFEEILRQYLPNIKVLRFKMLVEFSVLEDIEDQVDGLIHSYQSDYWIKQLKLIVRCDWHPADVMQTGLLYTVPYAFGIFSYTDGTQSKSSDNSNEIFYNSSEIVHFSQNKKDLSTISTLSPVRFCNVHYLKIKIPFNETFWFLFPTFNQLTSLEVEITKDFGYAQLQTLLDKLPNLYSLRFCHLNRFLMTSFNITSKSIRRLEFSPKFHYDIRYFNNKECAIFAASPLAAQCEVLTIDIENQTSILELIKSMPNLRALSVLSQGNQGHPYEETWTIDDNVIQWLNKNLPSNYTFSTYRNLYYIATVNIWISKII